MKKYLFMLFFSLTVTLVLVSCVKDNQENVDYTHIHLEIIMPAVESTCSEKGLTEGKKCLECGEILIAQQETPQKAHIEEVIPEIESTCADKGLTEGKKCSICNEILVAQQEAPLKSHAEVIDKAVDATCTNTGLTEGKHCLYCDTIIVYQLETPMIMHIYDNEYDDNCNICGFVREAECSHNETVTIEGYEATCTSTGLTAGLKCNNCGVILIAQEVISIKEHIEIVDIGIEATCISTGLTEGKHCYICNKILVAQEVLPFTAHTETIDEAINATCTNTGLTEGKHCSKCGIILVAQSVINKLGHKYDTELDLICNICQEEREIDNILLSISKNDVFGYVNGLNKDDVYSANILLYNAINSYATTVGSHCEYFFEKVVPGEYYLKIEISGYQIPSPIKVSVADDINVLQHLNISKVYSSDFFYQWKADDTYFGYEESATIPQNKTFTFLDEVVFVNDSNATANLYNDYKIVLSNEDVNWTTDYASRMLELVEEIYAFPHSLPSKWILTSDEIDDDVEITYGKESTIIRISKSAFENAIPRKAEYNGLKGTYFSNRLYHALIRYATKEGTDISYIDSILRHNYGCSIIVNDYAALTAGSTNDTDASFEMFKSEELLAILEMFAEMPEGLHQVKNLKYLVRRIDGHPHPLYPDAAAVSWPNAEQGYIEFMDKTFLGSEVEDTFRLVLHEKAHFLWEHVFSDELKAKWIDIGGWYKTPNDTDGWSTTKETEFVTAYSHAINPDEDMAESIAYYILMPDKLESRSPSKYAFIRDYIMNGEIYITQIREDLTFEVYNLYPDYRYPGKIVGVDIQVSGNPEEDKKVTVTITLDTNGDPSFGANRAIMRITSDDGTYYDLWVTAIDSTNAVLRGTKIFSKYACNGYWYNEEIELRDIAGNQRFVGVDDFGWKLYIDNPLADSEPPQYVQDSARIEMKSGEFQGMPVTYVDVKFKATDNIGIQDVYCAIANNTHNSYRMDEYGTYDSETGEAVITYIFTKYMQSGEYTVNFIMLTDYAENQQIYYFYPNGSGAGYPATFTYESENSDYEAPTLDVNRITITAMPTHPENPNGETVVHIEYYAKDNASGLGVVSYKLLDPLGNTHFEYHYHENFYTVYFEGDPTAWTKYEIKVILPEGSAPGIWGLLEIYVEDKAGNFKTYNFLETVHFQVESSN